MSDQASKTNEDSKGKGGSKLFLMAGVAVLLLGGGAGFWWFSQGAADTTHAESDEHLSGTEHAGGDDEAEAGDSDHDEMPAKRKRRKRYRQPSAVVDLDPFVVNLADPSGNRYVKARISLGVDEPGAAAELGGRGEAGGHGGGEEEPAGTADLTRTRARAVILEILSSYLAEEITSREGKTSLKEEIMEEVSALLHDGEVIEVLVTDLIVQ